MAAKILLCAVLAIFAFQTLNAHPASKGPIEDAIHNALLKAKQALHDLTVKLEALGQEAVEKISAVIDMIKSKAEEFIANAQAQIDGIKAAIDAKIMDMLELAAEHGVEIADCIIAEKIAVDALVDKTKNEVIKCVTDQVAKAQAILGDVLGLVKEGLDGAKESEEKIEACLSIEKPLKVIACLTANAAHDTLEAIRLGVLIGNDVLKAQALVQSIQVEIPICITAKLVAAEIPAALIVKDFGVCVMDKIINKKLIQ